MALDHDTAETETQKVDRWAAQTVEAALEPDLPIIDPHHHLWLDQRGEYLLAEFLRDLDSGHRITRTVFLDNRQMYRADGPKELRSIGEVEFINGLAAMSASGRFGPTRVADAIVGFADMRLGDRVRPVLDALRAAGNGRFRGIRHGVASDAGIGAATGKPQAPEGLLNSEGFRQGLAALAAADMTFDAWLFYPQLPDLDLALRALPGLRVVLNHCGGPLGIAGHDRAATFGSWRQNMAALARHPNLTVKVGGLGLRPLGFGWHKRAVPPGSEELAAAWRPYVETCIDLFGPERCMMESNFPADKVSCGYGVLWNALKRITAAASAGEKAALYHDTAAAFYRLNP